VTASSQQQRPVTVGLTHAEVEMLLRHHSNEGVRWQVCVLVGVFVIVVLCVVAQEVAGSTAFGAGSVKSIKSYIFGILMSRAIN